MKLSEPEELEFNRLFTAKHGFGPAHVSLKYNLWNVSVWNDEDICSIVAKPRHVAMELDALWHEIDSTDRNTTVQPVDTETKITSITPAPTTAAPVTAASAMSTPVVSESGYPGLKKPLIFGRRLPNILTNPGMKNMAQLSTAESVKTNTHAYVGNDSDPAEAVGDTTLNNQLLAKEFDSLGDRVTVDQQERYAMPFFRSDFGSDVTLREAGIGTGTTPPTDILIARVTFAPKALGAGQTMTLQLSVNHKNGTQ